MFCILVGIINLFGIYIELINIYNYILMFWLMKNIIKIILKIIIFIFLKYRGRYFKNWFYSFFVKMLENLKFGCNWYVF